MEKKLTMSENAILMKVTEVIVKKINTFSEEELMELQLACSHTTQTTCWWGCYEVSKILAPFIKQRLDHLIEKKNDTGSPGVDIDA